MNSYFDETTVEKYFPQAEELMWPPQLCWKLPKGKENMFEEVCGNGQYFASIKKDGACYQVVRTQDYCYLFGRTVSKTNGLLTEKIDNVPHIKRAFERLPPKTVMVVEIYYPGKTAKDVVSIMGCLPKLAIERQRDNPIHAYAHDILMYDGVDLRNTGAEKRYKILSKIWKLHNLDSFDFLELAQPIYENIFEEASSALKRGEEGLVLRKKDAGWSPGKRPAWSTIKLKQTDSVDLVCVGFCPPTKEYTGKEIENWEYWEVTCDVGNGLTTRRVKGNYYQSYKEQFDVRVVPITKYYYYGWPSAIKIGAYTDTGELKLLGTVSSGLTDEDKQNMGEHPENYLNKVVSLDCMSIDSHEMTLRHPVFKGWREDKPAVDCQISEVFK